MELKFLFGSLRAVPAGKEDCPADIHLVDAMLVSRRTHTLQHLDMKRHTRMHPSAGGFVKRPRKTTLFHWYGESESCQVDTDGSLDKCYRALATKENIWKTEFEAYGQSHAILMFLPEGYTPSILLAPIDWVQVNEWEGALEILRAEDSSYTR